jgi:hypothetical protein
MQLAGPAVRAVRGSDQAKKIACLPWPGSKNYKLGARLQYNSNSDAELNPKFHALISIHC